MTKQGWVISGLAALLFFKVLRSVRALKITLKSYEIDSVNVSDGTVGMYMYFQIVNPLWVGITLRGISGELTASSGGEPQTIGTVNNVYNYFIRGNATHVVRAKIAVSSRAVVESLITNINSGDVNNLLLTFNGKISFGQGREVAIPINRVMTVKEFVQ